MSDGLWGLVGAVISALLVYAGVVYRAKKDNDALYLKLDKQSEIADTKMQGQIELVRQEMKGQIELVNQEVSGLRQEVAKHNSLVERTYKLEKDYSNLELKAKVADKRIADLEVKTG